MYPASSARPGRRPARAGRPHRRQPVRPAGRGIERRRAHAQRVEDVRAEQLVERAAEPAAEGLGEEVEGRRGVAEGGPGGVSWGRRALAQQLGAVAATQSSPSTSASPRPVVWVSTCHVENGSEPGTVEPGSQPAIGSARSRRPASTSCRTAVATIGLVIEARRQTASTPTRAIVRAERLQPDTPSALATPRIRTGRCRRRPARRRARTQDQAHDAETASAARASAQPYGRAPEKPSGARPSNTGASTARADGPPHPGAHRAQLQPTTLETPMRILRLLAAAALLVAAMTIASSPVAAKSGDVVKTGSCRAPPTGSSRRARTTDGSRWSSRSTRTTTARCGA